jgi:hypothetical protein
MTRQKAAIRPTISSAPLPYLVVKDKDGADEEVSRAAWQMASIDGWSGHGAAVLEQKREVRGDRGQDGEGETEDHRAVGLFKSSSSSDSTNGPLTAA